MPAAALPAIPSAHVLEPIAATALVTVPTVRRVLRGQRSKPRLEARVRAAVVAAGLGRLLPGAKS